MNWPRSHAAYFQVWSFARIILLAGLIEVLYNVGTTVPSGQDVTTLFSWNILCNNLGPSPTLLVRCQVKNYLNWFPNSAIFVLLCLLYSYGQRKLRLISGSRLNRQRKWKRKKANPNWSKMLPLTMSVVFTKQEGILNRQNILQSLSSSDMLTSTKTCGTHICYFLRLAHFEAWEFGTQRCINLRRKIPRDKIA